MREAAHKADKAKAESRTAEEQLKQAKAQTVIGQSQLSQIEREQEVQTEISKTRGEFFGFPERNMQPRLAGTDEKQDIINEAYRRLCEERIRTTPANIKYRA